MGARTALITAGPTREYLDPVRFLSNASSGRMGFEVARAFRRAGWRVLLVTGPVALPAPAGVRTIRVESAREMLMTVRRLFPRSHAFVATAAVADHRPAVRFPRKLASSGRPLTLRLVPNPDIAADCGARRTPGQVLIGFALETHGGRASALHKLRRKRLDYIVLNDPRTLGGIHIEPRVLDAAGRTIIGPSRMTKRAFATRLVHLAEEIVHD